MLGNYERECTYCLIFCARSRNLVCKGVALRINDISVMNDGGNCLKGHTGLYIKQIEEAVATI